MLGQNKMEKLVLNNQTITLDNSTYYIDSLSNSNIEVLESTSSNLFIKNINDTLNIKVLKYATLNLNVISLNNHDINICLEENATVNFLGIVLDKTVENLNVNLNGFKSRVQVKYLSLLKDSVSTLNTTINHNFKETYSDVYNVGVSLKGAHITFNTLSKIFKGMSKSEASQLTRGVLLDSSSIITSEPILKIDEFDIKANHGTALGRMSDDELFYLMSRGLSKEESYKLILNGLINPILSDIFIEEEKNIISKQIFDLI